LNGRKTGIAVSALPPLLVFVAAMTALFVLVRANARLRRVLAPQLAALRTVGLMTFPLYLMHNVAGATLLGWLVTHGLDQRLALGSVLALALAASYVVAVHLEPPLQRWTRQALLRLRPAIEPR
jgi:peptidoglycan/LPS O-acetylase OafA/YrhL